MTLRVVTISVGKRATPAVCCPGHDEPRRVVCGQTMPRAGRCPHCGRVLSEAEFRAALAVNAGEAAA